MKPPAPAVLVLALTAGLACAQDAKPALTAPPATVTHKPQVQLAILLDTSGSMDGLIDQAKTQLWNIVNDLAAAKQHGQHPDLKVALYECGKQSIPESEHFLRQILPLTDDLDAVSQQLFALTTNGGEEYCAQVIKAATDGLSWSADPSDLKIIVIAGNEPFTQGTVDYHTTVTAAVRKGIIINTIFCGPREEGTRTNWEDGAILGEGTYACIDQSNPVPNISAPQDDAISRLGTELNKTYVAYGAEGEKAAQNQTAQDANALAAGSGAPVQRAMSKASGAYQNARWDLIDAVKDKKVNLAEVKKEELPEAMRTMTPAEREAYVKQLTESRDQLQRQIQDLSQQRDKFIAEQRRNQAAQPQTLGSALTAAVHAQAEKKGFEYDKK